MRNRAKIVVFAAALIFPAFGASAQSQGTCLAVINTLKVPIEFFVDSTNGTPITSSSFGGGNPTLFQYQQIGRYFTPWIVTPGGPHTLVVKGPDDKFSYVASQNGDFTIEVMAIDPPASPTLSVMPRALSDFSFAFHSEMTAGGACNGTEVATVN